MVFDVWVYQSFGAKGLAYLILGTALALGVHPTAGHFIAEHYMFCKGQGLCFIFHNGFLIMGLLIMGLLIQLKYLWYIKYDKRYLFILWLAELYFVQCRLPYGAPRFSIRQLKFTSNYFQNRTRVLPRTAPNKKLHIGAVGLYF